MQFQLSADFLQFATYLLVFVAAFAGGGLSRHQELNRHVPGEGTPGSTVLCEVTRDFSVILASLCSIFPRALHGYMLVHYGYCEVNAFMEDTCFVT